MGMGHRKWCIPDLYVKEPCNQETPSHECLSFVNNGMQDACVCITALFEEDTPPIVIDGICIKSMQSLHLRLDKLEDYEAKLPIGTPYSMVVESTENVVLGYARFNWIEGNVQSFGYIGYFED